MTRPLDSETTGERPRETAAALEAETTGERAVMTATRLQRQLETAQEITHIGSWEWDLASGVVGWSDELYRIYGLAPRSVEVTVDGFLGRVHPDDRERIQGEIARAIERRGRFSHRERIVRPDGSVRELDTVGEVVCDRQGRPMSLIGTCRDITEERRREEAIALYADVFDSVGVGLSVWSVDDPRDPTTARLVAYNPATEDAIGHSLAGAAGRSLAAILPSVIGTELPALLGAADGTVASLTYRFPDAPHRTFAAKAFRLPDRSVGLALEDVSERVRAERLQGGERRVLEMLAAGAALPEVLATLVRLIEELSPDTIASILLLSSDGQRLEHGAAPGLPDAFNRAIDGTMIGPVTGSCGTAAYRRAPVYVEDIELDPLWKDWRDLARAAGLRACWSHPILANDGRALGTFAVYYRTPRVPDPAARDLIARAAHVAAIVIERRQLDDQLRALPARLDAIREDERTGIAREIHDELGQALTALKMDIAWLRRRVGDPDALLAKLDEMSASTDEVIRAVRRISAELRPGILDDLGLPAAIEWQAEEWERRTGIATEVRSQLGDLQLERGLATAAFRIFLEALTNVARHASAAHVVVELGLERGQVKLEIRADGVGIAEPRPRNGSLGLLGMRERARRLGGDCVVRARPGGGTTVSVQLPLRFPAERRTDADNLIGG